ncbi:MAG TPA: hypothetical protein VNO32_24190 [Candidatus Acidoferrum sp.]|jgi:hypothetical protein|nr:hypothetical protein [Candidatus Acidoferrum sp.]
MPIFNSQQNGARWRGIATTVVVELLVLLALRTGLFVTWNGHRTLL